MNRLLIMAILVLALLSGCSLFGDQAAEIEETPAVATQTPGPTPTIAVPPQATEPAAAQDQAPIKLWVIEELSPAAGNPGGSILAEQLDAYETNHPGVEIQVEVKSGSGRGSIINYLRFGGNVAPTVLPDLIAVPAASLAPAASEGLIYPLDEHVDPADKQDLFPAGQSLSQVGNQMVGYPITLSNLSHMAYSTSIFTQTVPLTWTNFIETGEVRFAFPGSGRGGAELLLQMYLAEGGTLSNESNQLALQVEPLTRALEKMSRGRANGSIILESTSLTSLSDSWQAFGTLANSVQTVDSQYLVQRGQGIGSDFAGLPGVDEPLAPLVNGWAWAVSAPEPARQAVAADILNWLIAGPNMGDWSLAASRLPARRSSFEQWPQRDDYTVFLQQELERAQPFPAAANAALFEALGTALFDVLSLASSPDVAAQHAVDALQG